MCKELKVGKYNFLNISSSSSEYIIKTHKLCTIGVRKTHKIESNFNFNNIIICIYRENCKYFAQKDKIRY